VSTLTLIRHGQAAPFQRTDAALTPTGEAQAAKLAQFWLRNGVRFDEVHCGALARQVRTAQVVAECFRESGQSWPDAPADRSWNEYDATGVIGHYVPADARLAALAAEYEKACGGPDENRRFQHMFEAAMGCWLEGKQDDGVEPWSAFRDRVTSALRRIMKGPASRRVAVFTSGGPIGFAVHYALQAPAQSFLDLNWRVRNCSVSEFVFDPRRFTLDYFNAIPHLDEAVLRTYR
jgi:broad specificity phosphatase PhoE